MSVGRRLPHFDLSGLASCVICPRAWRRAARQDCVLRDVSAPRAISARWRWPLPMLVPAPTAKRGFVEATHAGPWRTPSASEADLPCPFRQCEALWAGAGLVGGHPVGGHLVRHCHGHVRDTAMRGTSPVGQLSHGPRRSPTGQVKMGIGGALHRSHWRAPGEMGAQIKWGVSRTPASVLEDDLIYYMF